MKHTISILVENNAGVLARISGLFARRGYNIHSLAVGVTDNEKISRITIVAEGSDYTLEQIEKQLNKLIDVIKVRSLSADKLLARELVLVKVACKPVQRTELIDIAEIMAAKISDVSPDSMTLELSGNQNVLTTFEELLSPYEIIEIVRTGTVALQKGSSGIRV
ncbi:MAG: acetolactate synthase small subunit [Oscillospiraceae bacterium]|nr:acetolactate synthase small subunit [Oscillospiraceae bacterium]